MLASTSRVAPWLAAALVAFAAFGSAARAADNAAAATAEKNPESMPVTAPVVLDGHVLFRVSGVAGLPADQRASGIGGRIEALAADPAFDPQSLKIVESEGYYSIMGGLRRVMVVTDADAQLAQASHRDVAAYSVDVMRQAIPRYRAERGRDFLLPAIGHALGATAVLGIALVVLLWLARRLEALAMRRIEGRIESLGIQSFEIVRADRVRRIFEAMLHTLRGLLLLALVFAWGSYVLQLFPWTRQFANGLLDLLTGPLLTVGRDVAGAIPNLFFLVILWLIVRFALRVVRLFFDAVARGTVKLANFEAEWAEPTYKIVRLAAIALALIVAYPYIPGSDSAAFKGVSLFAGVLLSLGSSSTIANIIAGYMMTYRRAFHVGDRVQIGDTVGDVIEMRLQVTHLRTLKNEEVVIPNSLILNSHVTNFSTLADAHGLILHATVGIGYETPWRQVEAMLLLAAERTPSLEREPAPFVLQKSLGDFAVVYEINAHCRDVKKAEAIYTDLRRNILDLFNEYGVAIMTPAYEGDPEEPKFVPKAKWYAAPAKPPQTG